MNNQTSDVLFQPLELPCGSILKNRIAKAAMSDSLGDGRGNPTPSQLRLYETWAEGGLGLSIVGEVQSTPDYPEKPGNLVLNPNSDFPRFDTLAQMGAKNGAQLWLQLGHAGAMAHEPISAPKGPSAIDIPGLKCAAMTREEISGLPPMFASTATLAKNLGFGGVEIHAAHGFLLSQFLSPLFDQRGDAYGGSIENRMRIVLEILEEVRSAVGRSFPIGVKLNATDNLEGGLTADEAFAVVSGLDVLEIDLVNVSGGTYFPGAKSASDGGGKGPYYIEFSKQARQRTNTPLMLTGGVKTLQQAAEILSSGAADIVGLARAMVLYPDLANRWRRGTESQPEFPRFSSTPEGGVTAWYTMKLTEIVERHEQTATPDIETALEVYLKRDAERAIVWNTHFGGATS
ncbi:NADH:flavin oxidoreductase/NADH oxidase family protein [Gammaproteobacteria bacterium]|nr:NADH:flavin oxidoreductase/NADH oxidase family protein [Gammaproteobacteria bacterium]